MKKLIPFLFFFASIMFMVSCAKTDQTTGYPADRVFNVGESIRITDPDDKIDVIELEIRQVSVVNKEPVKRLMPSGSDSEGKTTYTEVTLAQIFEVAYAYTNVSGEVKTISCVNFDIVGDDRQKGYCDPFLEDEPGSTVKPGESIVRTSTFGVISESKQPLLCFNYNPIQKEPTAVIRLGDAVTRNEGAELQPIP